MSKSGLPTHMQPMLATLIAGPFNDPDWIFETKWDGIRVIAEKKNTAVTLYSRSGQVLNTKYPTVVEAIKTLQHDVVIDGELVVFNRDGVSRFQLLQNALRHPHALRYCVFDLLFLDGEDVRQKNVIERKKLLNASVPKNDTTLMFTTHSVGNGVARFAEAQKKKEEGIVAKRKGSTYQSGKRSRDWLKIKTHHTQEAVVVGFTKPYGSRRYFSSLVLAVRENNQWRYVGKVGTGFNEATLREVFHRLQPLIIKQSPLRNTTINANDITWVKPTLVVAVKFSEWTDAGQMRHPVYLGIREDKKAKTVVREQPANVEI